MLEREVGQAERALDSHILIHEQVWVVGDSDYAKERFAFSGAGKFVKQLFLLLFSAEMNCVRRIFVLKLQILAPTKQ